MLRVDPFEFYNLANAIHPLTALQVATHGEAFGPIYTAKSWLVHVYQNRLVPLTISKPACDKLYMTLIEIVPNQAQGVPPIWRADE